MPELHQTLYSGLFQIILINETWLDQSFTCGLLDPENRYHIFRKDRTRNGGGVCALIGKKFNALEVHLEDHDSRLAYPRPRPRPRLAHPRPRPRPRLGSFKTKTKTKTCLSKTKTKTKTRQFQDQDQDQDLLIQDPDRDRDSRLTRPILEVHDWDEL